VLCDCASFINYNRYASARQLIGLKMCISHMDCVMLDVKSYSISSVINGCIKTVLIDYEMFGVLCL